MFYLVLTSFSLRRTAYPLPQSPPSRWELTRVLEGARRGLRRTIEGDQAAARSLPTQLTANLRKLDQRQENLVYIAADGTLPRDVVQRRMNGIAKSRAAMTARLENTEKKLTAVLEYIDAAFAILERPGDLYAGATNEQRRMLNQAVFSRIYVEADEVTGVEFNEPFDLLIAADEQYARSPHNGDTKTAPANRGGVKSSEVATLVNIAKDDISSNADVVGTVGPASKKSGGLLPPLEKLRNLAALAAAAPADSTPDEGKTSRSWLIRRRLSDEQVSELVELYRSGVGTPVLCAQFGISKPSVLELLHERGVQMRRQPLSKTQRARAVQLYEEGLAIKPIAAELGSSFGAVHRVLKAEGVRLRPRPGR